jgi:hypothetical protein
LRNWHLFYGGVSNKVSTCKVMIIEWFVASVSSSFFMGEQLLQSMCLSVVTVSTIICILLNTHFENL